MSDEIETTDDDSMLTEYGYGRAPQCLFCNNADTDNTKLQTVRLGSLNFNEHCVWCKQHNRYVISDYTCTEHSE